MAAGQPVQAEQILAHTVYYATSKCPIKDDVPQLAGCWKTGSGPLTKQEAGLLLWYHSQRDEDGLAEVLSAGVVSTCLGTLDDSTALPADKSTAAGLLLSLCADDKGKEQLARSKASGANGSSYCQVLHACLASPESAPRHVMAVLEALARCPTTMSLLLKSLAGAVPWATYINILHNSHKAAKDHTTAIEAASYIKHIITGHKTLGQGAAAAGVLEALLTASAAHKSAAAVCACANCLLEMCLTEPELCKDLGNLPCALQKVVDLLGPPPAPLIAWEQQQLKQQQQQQQMQPSPHPQPTSPASITAAATALAGADTDQQPQLGRAPRHSSIHTFGAGGTSGTSSNGSSSTQHVRVSERDSIRARSRAGALVAGDGADTADGASRELQEEHGSMKARRKSLRILDVPEGEALAAGHSASATGESAISPSLRSKSLLGCLKQGGAACNKGPSTTRSSCQVPLHVPALSVNSTALKWEGPVPEATRRAAAGLLAQLVQLPQLREVVSDRLAATRLAALLVNSMQQLLEGSGKKGKSGGKKGGNKLAIPADTQQLLTHVCVCLEFLVAGSNADCYRVAAANSLPALVRLATDSKCTHLRRAAKAVVSQVVLLSEARHYLQQVQIPEDVAALQEGSLVPLKLTDAEIRQLLVEYPAAPSLHVLDDVTARARC